MRRRMRDGRSWAEFVGATSYIDVAHYVDSNPNCGFLFSIVANHNLNIKSIEM